MVRNPYDILGITIESSEEEAKSAYRKLAKMYHPDGSNGDIVKFREVQEAWNTLKERGNKAFGRRVGKLTHETLFTFRRK